MGDRGIAPRPAERLSPSSWRRNPDRKGSNTHKAPKPAKKKPICPEYLEPDAKKEFRRLTTRLEAMRVLSSDDLRAISRYCSEWVRWKRLAYDLYQNGETQVGKDGIEKPRAQVSIANNLSASLLKLEAQFGLTPSARTRIQIEPEKPEPSKADEFFVKVAGKVG